MRLRQTFVNIAFLASVAGAAPALHGAAMFGPARRPANEMT